MYILYNKLRYLNKITISTECMRVKILLLRDRRPKPPHKSKIVLLLYIDGFK